MAFMASNYKKTTVNDEPLYSHMRTGGELFSIKQIDESGVFYLNNKMYSKTYILSDINFAGLTDYEQKVIIVNFSKILNSMSCRFSYTIANEDPKENSVLRELLYEMQGDEDDEVRSMMNELIEDRVTSSKQGLYQVIYLTLTTENENFDDAVINFGSIEASLRSAFMQLGSGARMIPLDINQRMQLFYNFTHVGIKTNYKFDFRKEQFFLRNWSSTIAPVDLAIHNNRFELNGRIGSVLYISEYSKTLDSSFVSNLMDKINCISYMTVSSELLTRSDIRRELSMKQFSVENKIDKEKKEHRRNNDFLSDANDGLLKRKNTLEEFARKLEDEDDNYFNTTITYMFLADNQKEYEKILSQIESIVAIASVKMKPCFYRQREGINMTFMVGTQEFKRVCNFSAPCLAMFIPFKTQELKDKGGTYLGINQLSQNVICGNRKKLPNRAGMYLGMSRHGKSVFAKTEMLNASLKYPEDTILIIDPQGEYGPIIRKMHGTELFFSAKQNIYANPLDVDFEGVEYGELQMIIAEKSDFVLTLLSSCMHREVDAKEKGVIDAVVKSVYSENYSMRKKLNGETTQTAEYDIPSYMRKDQDVLIKGTSLSNEEQIRQYSPLLQDIYQKLRDDDENDTAQELANHMEVFVNGSLNLFNHRTNIDLNKKRISFNLLDIQQNLRDTAMLVMLEIMQNKIRNNFKKGFWTWFFIDEFHELLGNARVCDYVIKLWKEVGKLNGIATGITQNMTDLLSRSENSEKLQAIISNTLYFAVFNQSTTDRQKLMEFLPSISPAMFDYVEGAEPGTGLLVYGNITIPFDFKMKETSAIYQYVNTDGHVEIV